MTAFGVRAATSLAAAAVIASSLAAPAQAKPPWRTPWAAASRAYRYEATQGDPAAAPAAGQRVDFRLATDAHGGVVAHILAGEILSGGAWKPLAIDASCREALSAQPGEVAEVRLQPLSPDAAKLGGAFMATCAPDDLFNPMTDILNVALIINAEQFHARDLTRAGQTVSFPGLSTSLDRGDFAMSESSGTGEVTLVALDRATATLDWKPSLSKLEMTKGAGAARLPMSGTEHFAFRVTLDRRTGLLTEAHTLYDDIAMTVAVPGLAADKRPHIAIRRLVSITPLAR
jgi:hypothetical protein